MTMYTATIIHQDGTVTDHVYDHDEGLDMALDSEFADTQPLGALSQPVPSRGPAWRNHKPEPAGFLQRLSQLLGLR